MSIVGRTYLERGKPVVIMARWNGKGSRNVLIRRQGGEIVTRPFRGLRRSEQQVCEFCVGRGLVQSNPHGVWTTLVPCPRCSDDLVPVP